MAIKDLKGKLVFITGAASGIGQATALAFADQGALIAASDLNLEALAPLEKKILGDGGVCHSYSLDVCAAQAFDEVAERVCADAGVPHVVINNAGIGFFGSFLDTPPDAFRAVMDVNLYGVVNGCRTFLPRLIEAGGDRHLVNIASTASVAPLPNMSAYGTSKYAVHGLTDVLNMELEETSVGVTSVHPGIINTPIVANEKGVAKEFPRENLKKIQEYYIQNGCDPRVVGEGIVKAVMTGKGQLFIGPKAADTALIKRLFPGLARKLVLKIARETGFLY